MKNSLRIIWLIVIGCFMIIVPHFADAKSIVLDSFYPSPYGAYEKLRLQPIDPTSLTCDATQVGMVLMNSIDGTVQFCADLGGGTYDWKTVSGVWSQHHGHDKPFPLNQEHAVFVEETNLRVGVNTETPSETFEVNGTILTGRLQSSGLITGSSPPYHHSHILVSFERHRHPFYKATKTFFRFLTWHAYAGGTLYDGTFEDLQLDGNPILLNSRDLTTVEHSSSPSNNRNVGIGIYDGGTRSMLHVRENIEAKEFRAIDRGTNWYAYMTSENMAATGDYAEFGGRIAPGSYVNTNFEGQDISIYQPYPSVITPFVGIGVTGPHADGTVKLMMSQDTRAENLIMRKAGSSRKIDISSATTGLKIDAVDTFGTFETLRLLGQRLLLQTVSSGNVGMGVSNPACKLSINGDMFSNGSNTYSSDLNLKKDIQIIDNPLHFFKQIRGVYYHWNTDKENDPFSIGVVAQDVEKVYPEIIKQDAEGYKSVDYGKLVAPLVEAVKELKKESDEIEERIQRLESRN
ncbi:MAG: tail fiber domain-containing protein [Candidatus Omnitrophica bacterium]|nr:tail fiber domain-containing protein [Candidatus Omnitrophota bacterium]